jgi:hypothetical protein
MRRTALVVLAAFALGALAVPAAAANSKEFKVIQNAVKHPPSGEKGHGKEVTWLKVLIKDDGPDGGQIKVTLPVALIEIVLASADADHFKVDDDHCEIDLRACWRALKRAGPHALVEFRDDGAVFKVWLE